MKRKIALALACMMCLSAVPVLADSITVRVNEEPVIFTDAQPVIINSRTMVPLRGVFERLGYDIFWKADTKTAVMVSQKKDTIRVTAGSSTFYKGDKEAYSDVPAQIINGRMYLPLRAVGEAAGLQVAWEADTKTAYIGYGAENIKESEEVTQISKEEINAMVLNFFSAYLLEGIAGEYEDFTVEKGYTTQEYVDMVTDFVENETVGLTAQYKQELLTILKNNADNPDKLAGELEAFEDKMESIADMESDRTGEILALVGDDFEDTLEGILEKAASNEDLENKFENAEDTKEYAGVYSGILNDISNNLADIKPESSREENALELYKSMVDVMINYIDYIGSDNFDMEMLNIVL